MRMKETLTPKDRARLFVNNEAVGLFSSLFKNTDPFYDLAYPLCLGYYTVRSANKNVAPVYEQIMNFATENGEADPMSKANELLGETIIRPKFIDKWLRVYDLLVTKQYDALKGFEHTEHKDGDNSDTTTYDTNVEDTGETGTKETTTTNSDSSADVYGFNSRTAVGDTATQDNTVETLVGLPDDNTSHNVQTKTGTDTKKFVINEDITKSGRDMSGAELVQAELTLRNTQLFFDIVYKDIDSVATLSIYN